MKKRIVMRQNRVENKEAFERRRKKNYNHSLSYIKKKKCVPKVKCAAKLNAKTDMKWALILQALAQ